MHPDEEIKRHYRFLEWQQRAQDDEPGIKGLFKEDGPWNLICFLSQQLAEKYFKGFLAYHAHELKKTHLLDDLLKECSSIDASFDELKTQAKFLNRFYIETRYPGDFPLFGYADAKKASDAAIHIKDFILGKIDIERHTS